MAGLLDIKRCRTVFCFCSSRRSCLCDLVRIKEFCSAWAATKLASRIDIRVLHRFLIGERLALCPQLRQSGLGRLGACLRGLFCSIGRIRYLARALTIHSSRTRFAASAQIQHGRAGRLNSGVRCCTGHTVVLLSKT